MIKEIIETIVRNSVSDNIYITKYRDPLIGYADAKNPLFNKLKEVCHPEHLLPSDLLENVKTVVAYFLPFTEELVLANQGHSYVSPKWALAYVETNSLIQDINNKISDELREKGVAVNTIQTAQKFDAKKIMSNWSHRHAAYIAGLGTFGINNLLITDKGCAGRIGTFVIDYKIKASPIKNKELCLSKQGEICTYCIDVCPVSAFEDERFARENCYNYLKNVAKHFIDIDLECDCCGKCACGPCAILNKGEYK